MVRGHTHNRLDAANQKPSGKYYGSQAIETPSQMVAAIRTIQASKYTSDLQWPIYNFISAIVPHINKQQKKAMTIAKV